MDTILRRNFLIEAIFRHYYLGTESVKRWYRFKSRKFWAMKRYKCFNVKKINWQSDCIISNPRIFQDEAIQSTFKQKNLKRWSDCIDEVIVSLQTPEAFRDEVIQKIASKPVILLESCYVYTYYSKRLRSVLALYFCVGGEGIHRFHLTLKGQKHENFCILASKSGPHIK